MGEGFQESITPKEAELKQLKSQGEAAYDQFINDTADVIKNWYKAETENYVTKNPDITKALGIERLKELKAKLADLMNDSESTVARFLKTKEICWHLFPYEINFPRSDSGEDLFRYEESNDKKIMEGIWNACDQIGTILKPFGYAFDPVYRTRYAPYRFNWSEPMKKSMSSYRDLYRKAKEVSSDISALTR
jgi:hypothetical protein